MNPTESLKRRYLERRKTKRMEKVELIQYLINRKIKIEKEVEKLKQIYTGLCGGVLEIGEKHINYQKGKLKIINDLLELLND